jgi:hypothetical protein
MAVVGSNCSVIRLIVQFVWYHVIEWQAHDIGEGLADLPFSHAVLRAELKDARQFTVPTKAW